MRWFVFILACALMGCSTGDDSSDGGGGDASSTDAGSDAGSDGGIDCSNVGCGAPPFCGSACDSPCGCCSCGAGEAWCEDDGGSGIVSCDATQGCYEIADCPVDQVCYQAVGEAPICHSCATVAAGYQALTQANTACTVAADCQVLNGHCGISLGGCYYVVNQQLTQAAALHQCA